MDAYAPLRTRYGNSLSEQNDIDTMVTQPGGLVEGRNVIPYINNPSKENAARSGRVWPENTSLGLDLDLVILVFITNGPLQVVVGSVGSLSLGTFNRILTLIIQLANWLAFSLTSASTMMDAVKATAILAFIAGINAAALPQLPPSVLGSAPAIRMCNH